jgi:hypothetical protein
MPYLDHEPKPKEGVQVNPTSDPSKFDQKPTYAGEGIKPSAPDELEQTMKNID